MAVKKPKYRQTSSDTYDSLSELYSRSMYILLGGLRFASDRYAPAYSCAHFGGLYCTGGKNRTLTYGFGDHHSTIKLHLCRCLSVPFQGLAHNARLADIRRVQV